MFKPPHYNSDSPQTPPPYVLNSQESGTYQCRKEVPLICLARLTVAFHPLPIFLKNVPVFGIGHFQQVKFTHISHALPPSYNIAAALVHTWGTLRVSACKIYNTTYSLTSYTGEEPKLNAIPVPSGRLSAHTQNKELLLLIPISMDF